MMNQVILNGRLTDAPKLGYSPQGMAYANFTVAVDRDYSGRDTEKVTDFIDCVAFKGTAEFLANNFDKGDGLNVQGEINTEMYKPEGAEKAIKKTRIVIRKVWFAQGRKKQAGQGQDQPVAAAAGAGESEDYDPFAEE